jgi:hypothetical protein
MVEKKEGIPYKVVGLVTAIFTVLAIIIGAVSWISINMANNAISIGALKETVGRHEVLISGNAEIIHQHAQLLSILARHGERLDTFEKFMTQGGRFTEDDGHVLEQKVAGVEKQLQHYAVLETELSWIKDSMRRLEININKRFDSLHKKLDVNAKVK